MCKCNYEWEILKCERKEGNRAGHHIYIFLFNSSAGGNTVFLLQQ